MHAHSNTGNRAPQPNANHDRNYHRQRDHSSTGPKHSTQTIPSVRNQHHMGRSSHLNPAAQTSHKATTEPVATEPQINTGRAKTENVQPLPNKKRKRESSPERAHKAQKMEVCISSKSRARTVVSDVYGRPCQAVAELAEADRENLALRIAQGQLTVELRNQKALALASEQAAQQAHAQIAALDAERRASEAKHEAVRLHSSLSFPARA